MVLYWNRVETWVVVVVGVFDLNLDRSTTWNLSIRKKSTKQLEPKPEPGRGGRSFHLMFVLPRVGVFRLVVVVGSLRVVVGGRGGHRVVVCGLRVVVGGRVGHRVVVGGLRVVVGGRGGRRVVVGGLRVVVGGRVVLITYLVVVGGRGGRVVVRGLGVVGGCVRRVVVRGLGVVGGCVRRGVVTCRLVVCRWEPVVRYAKASKGGRSQ
jgi:hypothetical protein